MRKAYKIIRNFIVSLLLTVAGLYVLVYIAVLLPPVQDFLCRTASKALSDKTGGRVEIGHLRISPFNEIDLYDVKVFDPKGAHVFSASNIGGGISLGKLIFEQRVIITYAEIIGLDGHITQAEPDGPLNIQFLIDAFKSKDKKEPTRFDIILNNVILRDCKISFDRLWMPQSEAGRFDLNHVKLTDLSADLRFPVLKNDELKVDLRRLTFKETSGLTINKISGFFHLSQQEMNIENAVVEMPGTKVSLNDLSFTIRGWKNLDKQILGQPIHINLSEATITPSDFQCFVPALEHYKQTVWLTVYALYNSDRVKLNNLKIISLPGLTLNMEGEINGLKGELKDLTADIPVLKLKAEGKAINSIITDFATLPKNVIELITRMGDVDVNAAVSGSLNKASFVGKIKIAQGKADLNAEYRRNSDNSHYLKAAVKTDGFDVGSLLDKPDFGVVKADVEAELVFKDKDISGTLSADVPLFTYKDYPYTNIIADVTKENNHFEGELHVNDPNLDFDIIGDLDIDGINSQINVDVELREMNLSRVNLGTAFDDISVTGILRASLTGNSLSNVEGFVELEDFRYSSLTKPEFAVNHLLIESERGELPYRLSLQSDYIDVELNGDFDLISMPESFKDLAAYFLPNLVRTERVNLKSHPHQNFDFSLKLKKEGKLLERFNSPLTLFEDLTLTGSYNSITGKAELDMYIPYLKQGTNRFIRDTRLSLDVDTADNKCLLAMSTLVPNDKGDINFKIEASAKDGNIDTDLSWDLGRKRAYRGLVSLSTTFKQNPDANSDIVEVSVNKSDFQVNDTTWYIEPAKIYYSDKSLKVDGIKVHRPGQYAIIEGVATSSPNDVLTVELNDIDLDYIFETLGIEYVQFGGRASGTLTASSVFTKIPELKTDNLHVHDMTYNHCVLGDALIKSYFDVTHKSVNIDADIIENNRKVADIYGDIFVVGDSLSMYCDAKEVNVGFLQPFMSAFSSEVEGRASGKVHLYGTFKDIDLTGKVFADSLRIKIDVLNTYYTVKDSVTLTPGSIDIKDVTIYDRNMNTALLNGSIKHEYFHNPRFDFTFTKAQDFLCYDTNAAINPIWYGTIYGNGSGAMHGVPGFIDIKVDMTTAPNSTFTFVLSDTEEAEQFEFLTFTDKRKEAIEAAIIEEKITVDDTPWYIKEFVKNKTQNSRTEETTRYAMDIRVTAVPSADLTIVMDPIAGDKIKANGEGALRMSYNSDGELDLYGTYTLTKGSYNFTMQDVIVRDFKIREGSKITFTGDPLAADLDITAAYRVNTSLTDLDKSFADDRELNRTNVPVEALLKVTGPMQSPDINFDIELPTLTEDVSRKVKSIISTADMMNRQIVYLLALNRFYTPDYMGTSGSNNELASVASTTLSTQLSSMLGELTPGWSFSPYFRTEKGDFSDMEVDLALSSALLNNRLLLNGNLGYRDKATSSTTFIGDFDIEYLLTGNGSWRLKAYNHFNDQNYYLRSALTTQGVGIVFKRDFNEFLPGFLRRKKKQDRKGNILKTEPIENK